MSPRPAPTKNAEPAVPVKAGTKVAAKPQTPCGARG